MPPQVAGCRKAAVAGKRADDIDDGRKEVQQETLPAVMG